ncbi:efflux RND transporter permease subunit [Eoetvoesiella caeni]|uniref:Multidrug efflux pump n=1 Tax=Eoetvoesiella caeni TaxID=645616 RepID=A0A366H8A1_9BURK|nr:efflux RND transporter permease subunit [Eoetvoesiella caeni]MCI2809710.1 efflux RND transporter permease subunit [Eoetvoesiella caeni]NYT56373.1 efflux RND transporter permease subunit [Eoetvoesiella caeni]RBP38432.1 multidrug efflux pump [Eoetvoesiella caeni]
MRFFALFIMRPVATTLLCLGMVLTGVLAYRLLAVSPLPQVDFPIISVSARLAGASPETMASSVATPLEQALGSIAGVTDMSSRSTEGSTRITLMFDLSRDINSAARDVQAAINAARTMLPSSLRNNPTYNKVNPNSAPVMVLALTSPTQTQGELYDLASTVIAQKLAQVQGVGEVTVGGSSLPAIRVSLNPQALAAAGIALDTVRTALTNANTMRPNGMVESDSHHWTIASGGQLTRAAQYAPLVVAWRDGSPVRLKDIATVEDSVEEIYNVGFFNDKTAVLLIIRRQPDANIIETVDAIRSQLPSFQAMLPAPVTLSVAQDRTPSIRASLHEAELTLIIAVILVVLVVLLFLRNWRAALIPSIVVPASLITSFSLMWWFGFTLNTISLMALIVATGFVVDDAIVVLENIMRHLEKGVPPVRAAMRGVKEVGFTVVAMSLSLVAVFIPLLLMGGLIGRLFREFAITLSATIMVSLVLSLVLTPMMCARFLKWQPQRERRSGALQRLTQGMGERFWRGYRASLDWALAHGRFMMLLLAATVGLNIYLYASVPKGFFPQQDTGQLLGFFRVDQGTSFYAMRPKLVQFRNLLLQDPAIESVTGFAGGRGGSNSSFLMIQLKPLEQRQASANDVVNRLRSKFLGVPGARLTLVPQQDIFLGGRQNSSASYDYSLLGSDLALLKQWLPKVQQAMLALPELVDVDSDVEDKGRRVNLIIDRDAASRLGVDMSLIASTLNNSFSQRQVSVIYGPLNQYHVVMAVDPRYAQDAESLKLVEVITKDGNRVPLSAFTRYEVGTAPLSVSHTGLFADESISFSLAPGVSLEQATRSIEDAVARTGLPSNEIQAGFQGTAKALQQSLSQQPWLILAALVTMYIVLGMLYESYIHPLTILSTLPSAGIGALLALIMLGQEFSLIALIGVFLLIGIVKKNAIMMVDFAVRAERERGLSSRDAIYEACLIRFRPIMMTTVSALFGALPLVLASGAGVEMRRPLGITIVGGLILSQILTLYTTPVVYLYLDRFRLWVDSRRQRRLARRQLRAAGGAE